MRQHLLQLKYEILVVVTNLKEIILEKGGTIREYPIKFSVSEHQLYPFL